MVVFKLNLSKFIFDSVGIRISTIHINWSRWTIALFTQNFPPGLSCNTAFLILLFLFFVHHIIESLMNNLKVIFQIVNELVKVFFLVSDCAYHLIVILQVLDLLVQEHQIEKNVAIFKFLYVYFISFQILLIPLKNFIDVKLIVFR